MTEQPPEHRSFFAELKRRHVFRVAAVYGVAAWGVIQGAGTLIPLLELPVWTGKLVVLVVALGFPVALTLAWLYDLTSRGLERTSDGALGTTPGPRRAWRWAAVTATVLALALAGAIFWRYQAVTASPTVIAVMPFTVRGTPSYLGEGIVELLSRNLDGVERLRTVEPATILTLAKNHGNIDVAQAREIAERAGAGLFVVGNVNQVAGVLRMTATLYEAQDEAGRTPEAQASVQGDSTNLFQLVDDLSAQLLAKRKRGSASERLVQTAAVTTRSLPALKAYLNAEQHLRAARFDSALSGFQQATELDSTFALAHYRLGVASLWAERYALASGAVERAIRFAERLPERDRLLLDALHASVQGKADKAEALYRKIREDYPDDVESTFQLADVLYHYNPLRGRPIAEAMPYFQEVLRADPQFLCPI